MDMGLSILIKYNDDLRYSLDPGIQKCLQNKKVVIVSMPLNTPKGGVQSDSYSITKSSSTLILDLLVSACGR